MHENPQLEAAIIANPNDTAAWAVYADWLQSQGDPRGELIALEQALAQQAPAPKKLSLWQNQIHEIYRNKRSNWAPDLAVPGEKIPQDCMVHWTYGYLDSLSLTDPVLTAGRLLEEMVERIFQQTNLTFLQKLSINVTRKAPPLEFPRVLAALKQAAPYPNLRELDLKAIYYNNEKYYTEEEDDEDEGNLGNLSPLIQDCIALKICNITSHTFTLSPLENRRLKQLSIDAVHLNEESLRNLGRAQLPAIEELNLIFWLEHDQYEEREQFPFEAQWLAELFSAINKPALRVLSLRITYRLDEILLSLVGSPLLKQLEELYLNDGDGAPIIAEYIREYKEHFLHLRKIKMNHGRRIDEALKRELKILFGERIIITRE